MGYKNHGCVSGIVSSYYSERNLKQINCLFDKEGVRGSYIQTVIS